MVGLTHHQDNRTKTPKKRKCHFKDPPTIDCGVTTKSQVHFWPCIQRTRLPFPFMGNALSHILIPVRAKLDFGTSGIVSSHGLIGSVSEARVIDVVLHLMHTQGRVVRQEARSRFNRVMTLTCLVQTLSAHDCQLQVHKFATAKPGCSLCQNN